MSEETNTAIDRELFDRWSELNEQKAQIADRIRKMEQRKGEVKEHIYTKVLTDYSVQLREIDEQLDPLKERIEQKKEALIASRDELTDRLNKPQDALDELDFRFELGEFDEQALKEKRADIEREIDHLKQQIARIDEQLKLFDITVDVSDIELPPEPNPIPLDIDDPRHEVDQRDIDAMFDEISNAPIEPERQQPAKDMWPEPEPQPDPEPEPEPIELNQVVSEAAEQLKQELPAEPAPAEKPASPAPGGWDDLDNEFFGSKPAAVVSGSALVLVEPGGQETAFPIEDDVTLIGSDIRCDVLIDEKSIERKHARIYFDKGTCMIKDLGSRNGTFVNGKKIKKSKLAHMDVLKVGNVKLTVRLH
ncbi:MAG: FHA domain-containing protein [Candidatus Alcyoniella australis]|nr:FHA domain-containing protein [Candidatus Alcyoniella australis]